jgi:AraC family transcriptional regulator, glycine betaine-responsive activator
MDKIREEPPRQAAILIMPAFSNLTLAAVMEPLRAANRMAGRRLFDWTVVTDRSEPISSSSGLKVTPDAALDAAGTFDMLFVVAAFDAERNTSERLKRFIRAAARRGVLIGGLESAAYVLAAAGVLDGYKATTHWEDLEDFAERFPAVAVLPDRFVIDRRRVTSSGALPTLDLMLELLRRDHGLGLALAVSSTFIYEQEHAGDDPQHMLAAGRLSWQDPLLVRAIRDMEAHIDHPRSIAAIARATGVGSRELLRRFRLKLQTSPKGYYSNLRLGLGRRLLEHTDRPISEVALATGFGSASAFARAFRGRFGMNPSVLRRAT